MKKVESVLLALVMLVAVPCLAFEGYQGHEGQIPLCQNKKTGVLRVARMKDIDRTTKKDYEPYCNRIIETMIWINIQGPQGPKGDKGDQGIQGLQGPKGDPGSQGLPGVGNLGVYDGNDLFLGYLVTFGLPNYDLYNIDIAAFISVFLEWPNPHLYAPCQGTQYFKSVDCTGQPYISTNEGMCMPSALVFDSFTSKFYLFDPQVQMASDCDLKSWKWQERCTAVDPNTCYSPNAYFPIKEVTVPLFNQTLQYPITVKPVH